MDKNIQTMLRQIRVLTLHNQQYEISKLYRLQKGWELRFMLGPTLASKDVKIFCNHPNQSKKEFNRKEYNLLEWKDESKNKGDKSDGYCSIIIVKAGSFQFYYNVNDTKCGSGYFVVDPTFHVGIYNTILPLDSVCMQTLLSKSLGEFQEWKQRLLVSHKSGYNVIHLTPVQELGCSNSSYSIADQLKINPAFSGSSGKQVNFKDLGNLFESLRKDWNMLTVTDVVWNHTAKSSPWLKTNPECSFNLVNSPHLKPAYILDRALFHLSLDAGSGELVNYNIPSKISCEDNISSIKSYICNIIIPKLKLWEFFQVDVDKIVLEFKEAIINQSKPLENVPENATVAIIQDPMFTRFGCIIDIPIAINQFCPNYLATEYDVACSHLKETLKWLNSEMKKEILGDLQSAIENVCKTIMYERLADDGPKKVSINKYNPLVTSYFLHNFDDVSVEEDEIQIVNNADKAKYIMAFNGWVMGDDPLRNFAVYPSKTYLRRELICWGDCVKLNYGSSPAHCPVLWHRMTQYTEITAKYFHGIRIDNCHSTPINVAEHMLDAARKIRPELYVFAELFTGNEEMDNIFVNRLGINSLIREAMNAWNSHELGRMIYKYGGEPVASFTQSNLRPLVPTIAHGLLYDATHDNPSAVTKKTVHDILPSSALVSMACCAIGSNRGHDELVPHHIHVVSEKRLYQSWSSNALIPGEEIVQGGLVTKNTGIIEVRNMLNILHQTMSYKGFNQVFVDQRNDHVVAVTRHNPLSHQSYVLIAHTAFQEQTCKINDTPPLYLEGKITGIALEASPYIIVQQRKLLDSFSKSKRYINGLQGYSFRVETDIDVLSSNCCKVKQEKQGETISFTNFSPGSIIIFRLSLKQDVAEQTATIKKLITSLENGTNRELSNITKRLNLVDLNKILFCCNEEEEADGLGIGAYAIPHWQRLPYCGLQGIIPILSHIKETNDLGHPVCANLRDGNWLLDYTSNRLKKHVESKELGLWLESVFLHVKNLPRYLVPLYFDKVLTEVHKELLKSTWSQMDPFIKNGSKFIKNLSLASIALCGNVRNASLPPVTNDKESNKHFPSLSAGLPHFSSGIMRNWGRDTFIAIRGLLLLPGRIEEAKHLILSFGGCIRHGLIPNLLGEGKICRYNCRDAIWWWLQSIQDICEATENGYTFLKSNIGKVYVSDDSEPELPPIKKQILYDTIQECLQKHMDGIEFTERGAGPGIDMNMTEKGFKIKAGINIKTGFVFGGSEKNCGTWMDKMGESTLAGTKGKPATPRDGSAVELVGLCKSTVSWLYKVNNAGKYPYDGVFLKGNYQTEKFSWYEWEKKIQSNFEKEFFVSDHNLNKYVHKRNIYKDTFGASQPWCDFQLRPNFPIAMVVAPELFHVRHAWEALNIVENKLLGPLGIKTLDPDDMMYRGNYNNEIDNTDASVAKGFNYHQGPEWVWPVGFFLRAKLNFAQQLSQEKLMETANFVRGYLSTHQQYVEESLWCGLPELTNSDGKWCKDSCEIQAWSNATIIEVLYDLNKYGV